MSSSRNTLLKGCLVIVGVCTVLGIAIAIFGVKAVSEVLERAARDQQQAERPRIEQPVPDEPTLPDDSTPSAPDRPTIPPVKENSEIAKRWQLPEVPVAERGNRAISNFRGAKNILYDLHDELGLTKTFYCGCDFDNRKPDLKSCGYDIRKRKDRARRTEAEHVMPASRFGHTFSEWTEGHPDCVRKGKPFKGRSCAEDTSDEFALMASDLYNLQPAIGEVNGDRLHYEWGEIKGEPREYGECDVEIRDQTVEPKKSIRGDIARTYLYMAWAYPSRIELSARELAMFTAWDREDPPSRAEKKRAAAIAKKQGNIQPFIR